MFVSEIPLRKNNRQSVLVSVGSQGTLVSQVGGVRPKMSSWPAKPVNDPPANLSNLTAPFGLFAE